MLKLKILFSALLLTASINTLAFCIHNHTNESIYAYSSMINIEPSKIVSGQKYCTKKGETDHWFDIYIYSGKTEEEEKVVCGSANIIVNDIEVVQTGSAATCIIS